MEIERFIENCEAGSKKDAAIFMPNFPRRRLAISNNKKVRRGTFFLPETMQDNGAFATFFTKDSSGTKSNPALSVVVCTATPLNHPLQSILISPSVHRHPKPKESKRRPFISQGPRFMSLALGIYTHLTDVVMGPGGLSSGLEETRNARPTYRTQPVEARRSYELRRRTYPRSKTPPPHETTQNNASSQPKANERDSGLLVGSSQTHPQTTNAAPVLCLSGRQLLADKSTVSQTLGVVVKSHWGWHRNGCQPFLFWGFAWSS